MDAHKRINVWIPDEIHQKLGSMEGTIKNNLCTILTHHFNGNAHDLHIDVQESDYDEIYNNFYNIEVVPLKTELKVKDDMILMLRSDKQYLQNQNSALMLIKMPLLSRIKMRLLSRNASA